MEEGSNYVESSNSNSSNHTNQIKRKRRSKNDPEGRMFICECGRGYLSQLALNNHMKSKHSHLSNDNISIRSLNKPRGRPKKNYEADDINDAERKYHSFFMSEMRKKQNEETINIQDYFEKIFNEVYIDFANECTLKVNSIGDHPFFSLAKIYLNQSEAFKCETCDEIFMKYLLNVSNKTNKRYFQFVLKFIILFRECLNKYKNIELENSITVLKEQCDPELKEFTQWNDAEQAPEICNEFISEYLYSADYFGVKGEMKDEFVQITQHFCSWLYENNFTSSKLVLVAS